MVYYFIVYKRTILSYQRLPHRTNFLRHRDTPYQSRLVYLSSPCSPGHCSRRFCEYAAPTARRELKYTTYH